MRMKHFTPLVCLFTMLLSFAGSKLNAQTAAAYTYARTTGATFTSISGSGTATSLANNDDLVESSVGIGFTFYFAGVAYTTVSISTNGWASLANYTADALYDNTASIPGAGFLMPYWDDLTGTNSGNNVYYTTTGTSPNRVFTIEWASWNTLNQPGNARKSNFQIKLYETSNVVQFCYGSFTTNTTTSTASIGIANSASDYKSLATVSATTASSSTFTSTLATWVANGSVFTWTPPCSSAPTGGTANATATTGCVPTYASTLSLSGATTTNVAYQWQSSPTGSSWTDVSGATNSTYAATVSAAIQYRCALRCIYSAAVGTSSARSLAAPGPTVAVSPTITSVCSGGSQVLTASGATTYTWSPATNLSATTGSTVTSTPTASRTYTVTGTTSGCTNTAVVTVNLSGGTPASITGTASACPGASSALANSVSGGTWSSSNTAVATVNSTTGVVTAILGAGGSTATITYATGCGSPATQTFTVLSAPTLTLNLPVASYCYGHAVPLIASGSASSYTWAPSAGLSATTGSSVLATPGSTTTYTVTAIGGSCNTIATSAITASAATDSFNLFPQASPSTTCSGGSSTLNAQATGYSYNTVSSITYSLVTQTSPTTVTFSGGGDEDTAIVSLPFTFNYYGTNYNSISIGTNGYITFGSAASNFSVETIPSATAPPGMVALFWSDLDLESTTPYGTVTTSVEGTAPNRKFVIYYKNVYDYTFTTAGYSGQIVLYETSNYIDLIVTSTTNLAPHVCGIQNIAGTAALTPSGRNNASYVVSTPEAWRFSSTPSVTYAWSPATFLSSTTSATPTASSVTSSTTYTVVGVNTVNNCVSSNTVAVNIGTIPGTISGSSSVCNGSSTSVTFTGPGSGTGTYTINGGSPIGFSFDASGSYVLSVSPTTTTTYELTGVASGVCSRTITGQTSVVTVNGTLPVITANPTCSGSTLSLSATASAGTYSWTGPNSFTSTLQNPTISSVTTLAAGTYTFSTTSTAGSCSYSAQKFVVVAQVPTVTVSATPTSICAGGTTNLLAVPTAPTSFTMDATTFTSYTTSGTAGPAADDARPLVTIPFTFNFYGTGYTQCRISANGFINFVGNPGVAFTPITLPSASAPTPMVALFWHDMNPALGGSITYTTTGTTPNRKFIVSYNSVPDNSGGGTNTGQIILHETTNLVDLMITSCNTTGSYNIVTGVQNATGTSSLTVPGRNNAVAIVNGTSEGWRFSTPSYSYSWSPATALSSSTVSNPVSAGLTSTQIYTVTTADIYSACSGNVSTQSITVNPYPVLYNVTGGGTYCGTSAVAVGLSNSDPAVSYQLYRGTTPVVGTVTGSTGAFSFGSFSTPGTYIVQATGAGGCVDTMNGSAVITNLSTGITLGSSPSVCQPTSTASLSYSSPFGSPTTYDIVWSGAALTAGFSNVTAGTLSGGVISLVIPSGSAGTFNGSLTVSNGSCTSNTYSFSVTVYAYPTGSITSANVPCSGYSTNIVFTGTSGATVGYKVDGGSLMTATLTGGTYSLSTGAITSAHSYTLYDVNNPVCTTVIDTTTNITPTIMQWVGGTSGSETDWHTAANWSCGFVPGSSDNVVIPSGTTYSPAIAASAIGTTANLTINSGAAVTVNSAASLNVKGNLNNSGTVAGAGTVIMNGSSAQTVSGIGTVNNFDLDNAAGTSLAPASRLIIKNLLSVTSGTLATSDSVVLYSDSANTARIGQLPSSGSVITGNVKVMQYVQGGMRRYRFWSHPFSNYIGLNQVQNYIDVTGAGGAANGFTGTATNAPSAFRYNPLVGNSALPSDPGWRPFASIGTTVDSNRIHRYQGLRLFFRGAKGEGLGTATYTPSPVTVAQWGSPNQGNQTVYLAKGTAANQDYNMIGNPYVSPVDIGTIIFNAKAAGNITGSAYYIWNPTLGAAGQFQAMNIPTLSATPYYIQADCAFQVRAAHNNDTLNFTESNKGSSATAVLFKSQPEFVSLMVYDESYHPWDMLSFQFNDAYVDADDNNTDADKLSAGDFGFYSISSDNKKLAIDTRPYAEEKVIPLGIHSDYVKDFIIRAENIPSASTGKLYLHDKLLKQYILLQQGIEYRFSITNDKKTQGDDRFELKMSPAETVTSKQGLQMQLMPNPATDDVNISFTSANAEDVNVRVMDISGVNIFSKALGIKANGTISVPLSHVAPGIYMVELTSGDQKLVQRLVKE